MSQVKFSQVAIQFEDSASADGILNGTGAVSFETNVTSAGAALQSWKLSYGKDDNKVRIAAAEISDVSCQGTTVSFKAKLQLIDDDNNYLSPVDCSMDALVIANVE